MERIYQDVYAIMNEVSRPIRRPAIRGKVREQTDLSHKVEMYVPLQEIEPWRTPPTKADIKYIEEGLEMRWKAAAKEAVGGRGTYKDDWRWRALHNAPPCDACGWCTEDL